MSSPQFEAKRSAQLTLEGPVKQWQLIVERASSQVLRRKVVLRLTNLDQLRLHNLKVWSRRYHVKIEYILQVLLQYWALAPHVKRRRKVGDSLGIAIASLVGAKSKEVLLKQILLDFPNFENVMIDRSDAQLSAVFDMDQPIMTYKVTEPMNFILAYRKRVNRLRRETEEKKKLLQRRPFRENPFI